MDTIRVLLVGGDVLNPEVVNAVLDAHPGLVLINGYGPTENTTFTCCHRMSSEVRPHSTAPIASRLLVRAASTDAGARIAERASPSRRFVQSETKRSM